MRRSAGWFLLGVPVALAGLWLVHAGAGSSQPPARSAEVPGKTQPARGRAAVIAPQTTQPIREVRVAVGEAVKKGQIVVQLDDDEMQAEVKAKDVALAIARAKLAELRAELVAEKDQAEAIVKKAGIEVQDEK